MDHKYNAERHNNDNLLLLILKNSFTPIKAKKISSKKLIDKAHQKIFEFWKFREFLENASIFGASIFGDRLYLNCNVMWEK